MTDVRKHVQVARYLHKDILAGKYGSEGGIPDVAAIQKEYSVSRLIAEKAVSLLEGAGLVIHRGTTYYVNSHAIHMTQYVPPIAVRVRKERGYSGYCDNAGDIKRAALPERIARDLDMKHTEAVIQTCILGEIVLGNKWPMQVSKYYYLLPISDEMIMRMQEDARIEAVFESDHVHLSRHDEVISRMPVVDETDILALPSGMSVLCRRCVVRDNESGDALLVQEDVFSPRVVLVYDYSFENRPKQ